MDPAAIKLVVRQHRDAFLKCYEHLSRGYGPSLQDRVIVRFVIGLDGGVTNAKDADSNVLDNEAVECVVRAISELRFPRPQSAQTVTYPVRFTPEAE
ncbi:MAG TPA: AgmX/PglI C-terminal domain-containing protein [Polyangiaceae bacterium]